MRCQNCNKFVSFEEAEPEVQNLAIDEDGCITAEVRIVNECAECNEELTEYTFTVEADVDVPVQEDGHTHALVIEEGDCERTNPSHAVPGKELPLLRYRKSYYGFLLTATVSCEGCGWTEEITIEDDIQASAMDEV